MVAAPQQKRVILNKFQDDAPPSLRKFVILKQVQDDDLVGLLGGSRFLLMPLRLAA